MNCSILFGSRKCRTIIHLICYKCPNCISHLLIIIAVSFGTQIRQIYEDQLLSRRYESRLDLILQHKDVLLLYHLTYSVYFSQLEFVINHDVWVVILVLKATIIYQKEAVIIDALFQMLFGIELSVHSIPNK